MTHAVCTLVPYFAVHEGKLAEFQALEPSFVARTSEEPGCLHYAFSHHGNEVHCREDYIDAAAVLAHLRNVGDLLEQVLSMADLRRLEVHAPQSDLERLRDPLKKLDPRFFELGEGFRR
ncbi:MAG: hypothetical protein CSA58_06435 [Micrococcales bacterium]|nr:MAG: hypothetical protein CSA58_06435 [Micrococcales bacterium]